MLAYTFYEGDNRVRRYAETFTARGDTVTAIVLRQNGAEKECVLNGVKIKKIQKRTANEKGKLTYLIKLMTFFLRSMLILTLSNLKKKYDVVHVHSVPDFEVFATVFVKMIGSKIILDIHDIVPELFASKFRVDQKSLQFRMLLKIEKASAQFADHIIVANHIWHKRLVQRAVRPDKCSVVLNYPDIKIFDKNNYEKKKNKVTTIVYPGTLSKHQGLETAIRAIDILKKRSVNVVFQIYGKGTDEIYLKNLTEELKLTDRIFFNDIIPLHILPEILSGADIGVEPKSSKTFANEALSTKIFEFMVMEIPVIAADTLAHTFYFNDKQIMFFESDNYYKLADCIEVLSKNTNLRMELVKNANEYIKENNWQKKQNIYLDMIDQLDNHINKSLCKIQM
jgi:glycosyltransferase involved in cell wall biosynthesis